MTLQSEPHAEHADPATILRQVLADALRETLANMAAINDRHIAQNRNWAVSVSEAWIRSLREAFYNQYRDRSRFAVFGGKPNAGEEHPERSVPSGIPGWRRWEFLHDVAVIEVDKTRAAFDGSMVVFVRRAIWQVESEMALDGTEVAKDISKLRVGAADNKLLIVAECSQPNPQNWLDFIGRLFEGVPGRLFLGLMPTYSSRRDDARRWRNQNVSIRLFQCQSDGSSPQPLLPNVCVQPK